MPATIATTIATVFQILCCEYHVAVFVVVKIYIFSELRQVAIGQIYLLQCSRL